MEVLAINSSMVDIFMPMSKWQDLKKLIKWKHITMPIIDYIFLGLSYNIVHNLNALWKLYKKGQINEVNIFIFPNLKLLH
jgi:hypothetical protein